MAKSTPPKPPDCYGVKYIGNRQQHVDNLYGTNLVWLPGQAHNVSDVAANQMLKHTDVYEIAETVRGEEAAKGHEEKPEDIPPNIPPLLPNFDHMTKADMQLFAQQHYGEKLPGNMKEDNMRNKIMSLVGERGIK